MFSIMTNDNSDTWADPAVDFCDVTVTQGSFEASIDTYSDISCMTDVETIFDPGIRFLLTGYNEETGAQARIDLQLSDRRELLALAHRIIDEYGTGVRPELDARPATTEASD